MVNFYYTILIFSLALCLRVKSTKKSLFDTQKIVQERPNLDMITKLQLLILELDK